MFTKYGSVTERIPAIKPYQFQKPKPGLQILERFLQDDFI